MQNELFCCVLNIPNMITWFKSYISLSINLMLLFSSYRKIDPKENKRLISRLNVWYVYYLFLRQGFFAQNLHGNCSCTLIKVKKKFIWIELRYTIITVSTNLFCFALRIYLFYCFHSETISFRLSQSPSHDFQFCCARRSVYSVYLFGLFPGFLPFSVFYRTHISCHYQKY